MCSFIDLISVKASVEKNSPWEVGSRICFNNTKLLRVLAIKNKELTLRCHFFYTGRGGDNKFVVIRGVQFFSETPVTTVTGNQT